MHGISVRRVRLEGKFSSARPTIENDRAAAFAALTADDGFSLGVLFRDNRDGRTAPKTSPPTSLLSQIESQFHVAIRLAPQ